MDSARNIAKMRDALKKVNGNWIYCVCHILKLFACVLSKTYDSTTKHIVYIINFFRNHNSLNPIHSSMSEHVSWCSEFLFEK